MIRRHRRGAAARALALAALLSAAGLPAGAGEASAALYTVETCTNGSLSGWSHFNYGLWSTWGSGCGVPGGALGAAVSTAAGSSAGWTFTAPPDTEIAAFQLSRAYALPANEPYRTGVYTLATRGAGQGYFNNVANWGAAFRTGPGIESASGLRGQTALSATVDCGGGLDCTGPGELSVYGGRIDLRDDLAPALGGLSGSLLAAGPVKGVRAVSYAATDRGGGVAREQLLVDGVPRIDRGIEGCSGMPSALVVPCPLAVSGTLTLDTTSLPEGAHGVALDVWDATGANRARYGPFDIEVDNVPPPRATVEPRISGVLREGATLVGADGEWLPASAALARRWQRLEGAGWEDIGAATGPTYTLTAEDAGRRLRLRVRATTSEGSTDAYSEPTPLVAAAPVAPAPTPTPAPTTAPPATRGPASPPRIEIVVPAPPAAAPAPAPSAPARPGIRITAAFTATGGSAITVPWGERRRVTGRLTRTDGTPVADARVEVTSEVRAMDGKPVALPHLTTDADGRFATTLGTGVSRSVTFSLGQASATVTVRVIPRVSLRVARAHGVVTLSGRVTGAPPGVRKVVELQVRRGSTWRALASTRLAAIRGGYRVRRVSTGRRFRAVVLAEPGWPFLTGTSATRG